MKAKTIDEAKSLAKDRSLETQYKDAVIYIIYCNRTEYFHIDTNSLIRLWESLIGYYINGVYTAENHTHNPMQITDLNGCPIEVIDLNQAIRIAKQYTKYKHEDKNYSELDKKLHVYWKDMHEKLTALKERLNSN